MRKGISLPSLAIFTLMFLSSCEMIGGVFKAGMWIGIIVVVIVVALVLCLINKVRK